MKQEVDSQQLLFNFFHAGVKRLFDNGLTAV